MPIAVTFNIHTLEADGTPGPAFSYRAKLDALPPVGTVVQFDTITTTEGEEVPLSLVVLQVSLKWKGTEYVALLDQVPQIKPQNTPPGYIYLPPSWRESFVKQMEAMGFKAAEAKEE